MNAIRKAAFAVSALAITCVGAALVTAPIAFARPLPIAAHLGCSTPSLQLTLGADAACETASPGAGLVAFNHR
jgi:hypothetical protein